MLDNHIIKKKNQCALSVKFTETVFFQTGERITDTEHDAGKSQIKSLGRKTNPGNILFYSSSVLANCPSARSKLFEASKCSGC